MDISGDSATREEVAGLPRWDREQAQHRWGDGMLDRSLRVRDDLVADSSSYNMLMTSRLRAELGPAVWGNWTLDPAIEPGMAGVLDPVSGSFELHKHGAIPLEAEVVEEVTPRTWRYLTAGVEEGSETTDGVRRETWTFPEAHTIASCGTQYSRRALRDPVRAVGRHHDRIRRWAGDRGYVTNEGVLQGFGVITATYQALGVVNLAARRPGGTYAVEGDTEGVRTLVGAADPYLADSASYRSASSCSPAGIEAFVYPARPDHAGPGTAPFAFEFLSFSGRTAIPGWVGHVPTMCVSFRNSGSYVVQCTLLYDTPDAAQQRKRLRVGCGLPGWAYLPIDATNLRVSCRFWHVANWGPRLDLAPVPRPMQEWHQGQGAVEIQGWWPGDYEAAWAT
jgi:hypothetical protein